MASKIVHVQQQNDASGDSTDNSDRASGYVERIVINPGTTAVAGATLTITDNETGEQILAKTGGLTAGLVHYAPRLLSDDNTQANIAGTFHPHRLHNAEIKCVLASAGATQRTVDVYFYISDEQPLV